MDNTAAGSAMTFWPGGLEHKKNKENESHTRLRLQLVWPVPHHTYLFINSRGTTVEFYDVTTANTGRLCDSTS